MRASLSFKFLNLDFSPFHLHLHHYCLLCFHFYFFPHKRQTDSRDASICHLRPPERHPCGSQWWGPPIPGDPLWGWSWTKGSDPRGSPALCPSPSATPKTRYVRVHFSSVLCHDGEDMVLSARWYSCPRMPNSYGWGPLTQAGSLVKSVHDHYTCFTVCH